MARAPRPPRRRLDLALVEDGFAPSREKAQALVLAGRVTVDGRRVDKPGTAISPDAVLAVTEGDRLYASRGGLKLAPVLDRLGIDPAGWRCLDLGASTGGFTDVLLRRGAAHVTAVDVGHGLLDAGLRADPRVLVVEDRNARHLRADDVAPPYDLATADLSFISLTLVLPAVLPMMLAEARLLLLVKPQFELSAPQVGRGGVVRDPELRARAVLRVGSFLIGQGWGPLAVAASPVAGPKGNREVILLAARGPGPGVAAFDRLVAEEVRRDVS
jgi:23S rRNA (cytidine1920-2'-O)/16S rRNA (cytidine1409-2'-O)-methyltransferase